nr:ASCH domain-containing protein [Ruficoccus amylovorans]
MAEKDVIQWNARYPIGTKVTRYKLINPLREPEETETRSTAWVAGGHSALVKVEGVAGGVLIESLVPVVSPEVQVLLRQKPVIPALSIRQPWAWLIVNGHKDIENRDWTTNYRGPVFVHASKTFGPSEREDCEYVSEDYKIDMPADFALGGIVGLAHIVDCVDSHESPWFFGKHGLVLKDSRLLPFTACKGSLGFFTPKIDAILGGER